MTWRRLSTVGRASLFGALLLLACGPRASVTFENTTDSEVRLFFDTSPQAAVQGRVPSGEEKRIVIAPYAWKGQLIARDESGNIVLRREMTWKELVELDRLVIQRQ